MNDYSFEQIMAPVWSSPIIYEESLTMSEKNGVAEASLLFRPGKILAVTSADRTMEYLQGQDWEIEGRCFRLTLNSRIFRFRQEELLFDEERPGECFVTKDSRYSLFGEGHFFHDRQISITYEKEDGDLDMAQESVLPYLTKMAKKLKQKEPLKIVLLGDSITEGYNSSGLTGAPPYLPTWGELLAEQLRRHYKTEVELINNAVAGKKSAWGIETAKERAGVYRPDLVIIAFGMNDTLIPDEFVKNITMIMEKIREDVPEAEFLLCATTLPNAILQGFNAYQGEYGEALKQLKQKGVGVADFGQMHRKLLGRKRFIDMTGNNVNHPNDFLTRCHAQLVAEMMMGR